MTGDGDSCPRRVHVDRGTVTVIHGRFGRSLEASQLSITLLAKWSNDVPLTRRVVRILFQSVMFYPSNVGDRCSLLDASPHRPN